MWPLLSKRGIGKRLERVVQQGELADDRREILAAVETAVQPLQLGRQTVESFEEGVELSVADVAGLLHGANVSDGTGRQSRPVPFMVAVATSTLWDAPG